MAKETGYELEKKRRKANLKERDDGKVPQEDLGEQRTPSTETAAVQRRPRQGSPGQTPQGGGGSPRAVLDELRAKAQGAGSPIHSFDPRCRGAVAYKALSEEVMRRLEARATSRRRRVR